MKTEPHPYSVWNKTQDYVWCYKYDTYNTDTYMEEMLFLSVIRKHSFI